MKFIISIQMPKYINNPIHFSVRIEFKKEKSIYRGLTIVLGERVRLAEHFHSMIRYLDNFLFFNHWHPRVLCIQFTKIQGLLPPPGFGVVSRSKTSSRYRSGAPAIRRGRRVVDKPYLFPMPAVILGCVPCQSEGETVPV